MKMMQTDANRRLDPFFWRINLHTLKIGALRFLLIVIDCITAGKPFCRRVGGNAEPSLSRSFTALHQAVFLLGCPWNQGPIVI